MGRIAGALIGVVLLLWGGAAAAICTVPDVSPVITAGDLDADGLYTGADIEAALRACSAQGGCTVQLLPERYDDVAILIHRGESHTCTPGRTACLDMPFANGLVIRGAGPSTVLRSPIWAPGVTPVAALELINRPEIPFRLESLVLNGRMTKQPGGNPNTVTWWHYGFSSWNGSGGDPYALSRGCVRNVTIKRFFNRGISLRSAIGWAIEDNVIEDIGCWWGVTLSCPLLSGLPDISGIPGLKVSGFGIYVGLMSLDVAVSRNQVRRTTKYGIGFKSQQEALEPTIYRPVVEDNQIESVGGMGLWLAGVAGGRFARNTIRNTRRPDPPELATWYDTAGIVCAGRVKYTEWVDHQVLDSAGIGLIYQCVGHGNRIADSVFARSCETKNPTLCAPGTQECYRYADLNLDLLGRGGGSLELENVTVEGSRCAKTLRVYGEPSNPFELQISGGSFPAGEDPSEFQNVLLGIDLLP